MPPKIKTSSATKSKKPSTNAVKVLWGEPTNPVRYYNSFYIHKSFLDQMPVLGAYADSAGAVQTSQNVVSFQGLHCLFTGISTENKVIVKIFISIYP